ncbi:MAG: NUDIX hydrolase, partial [Blastocatellia bacterium]
KGMFSSMSGQFQWLACQTEFRETRGDELRWMVNRETIRNTATGETVTRALIRHPGTAVIAAFPADEHVILMRQYRYSIDRELWELPAGVISGREEHNRVVPTETPEQCAQRELLEETGYEAATLEKFAECYATPGSNDGLMHFYAARDLRLREQRPDAGEVIHEVRAFAYAELTAMLTRGEIRDAKTQIGLFHILSRQPSGLRID